MRRDAVALLFAMTFPAVMAGVYFVALSGDAAQANPAQAAAYGLGKLLQFAFPLVYVWVVARGELRPAAPTPRGLAVGLGFGLLVGACLWGLYLLLRQYTTWLADTPAQVHRKLTEFGLDSPQGFLAVAAFVALVHSLFEEYYWRWFVFGRLRRHLPLTAAVALSSVAFMAHHVVVLAVYFPGRFLTLALPLSACVAVGGAVWAWLYARTDSLCATWLSHLLIDAAIMAVSYDMLRPSWTCAV